LVKIKKTIFLNKKNLNKIKMPKINKFLMGLVLLTLLSSCVSKKKFINLQGEKDQLQQMLDANKKLLADCNDEKAKLMDNLSKGKTDLEMSSKTVKSLEEQIKFLKDNNTNLLNRLQDLSIISQSGAESIKRSLDAMNEKDKYIKNLTTSMAKKDSLNLALVTNLKRSLADVNDQDVQIEVRKGVIFISISDKLLFKSGSDNINAAAKTVLAKVAKVLNDNSELDILVEGHTDNVPMQASGGMKDNWDLSAMRATAVVRELQNKYAVAPARMTAGGRSEFVPKVPNTSVEGKSSNRRTEIVILPKLDQFFQLSTPK